MFNSSVPPQEFIVSLLRALSDIYVGGETQNAKRDYVQPFLNGNLIRATSENCM